MSATDDYCELCDLPRSQCIHGRPMPATPPPAATRPAARPAPRKRTAAAPAGSAPVTRRPVSHRWTPPEVLSPLIVDVLREAGGALPADDLLRELHAVLAPGMRPGDEERTPSGEPRWQFAARRARQALIAEGVMSAGEPGVWRLA